jgi:hypothetical protein
MSLLTPTTVAAKNQYNPAGLPFTDPSLCTTTNQKRHIFSYQARRALRLNPEIGSSSRRRPRAIPRAEASHSDSWAIIDQLKRNLPYAQRRIQHHHAQSVFLSPHPAHFSCQAYTRTLGRAARHASHSTCSHLSILHPGRPRLVS